MLRTERLLLRKWTQADADSLFQYASDPEVGPITGWPPHKSVEESKEIIRNVLNGPECYAICEKENNIAIGSIELRLNGNTNMTTRDDACELGYWLGQPFWGRGYMPEAAKSYCGMDLRTLAWKWSGAGFMTVTKSPSAYRKSWALFFIIPAVRCRCRFSVKREWSM